MGLDMYLYRKVYVGLDYKYNQKGINKLVINDEEIDISNLSELVFNAAYWRKFNALHNYLVDLIQNGEDDCKEYFISREQLQEVIDKCKEDMKYLDSLESKLSKPVKYFLSNETFTYKIYENVNEDNLNFITVSGFFFGSTDYDEYFYNNLQDTITQLEKALENPNGDFYYSSSW